MTTGFGAPPTKDGNGLVTVGTSDTDIRRIFGALYTPGLVSGGKITRSASAFTYSVAAGVAIVQDTLGQNIAMPFDAAVLTPAAPLGPRTDIVYAAQRYPSDGNNTSDSSVYVGVGQTVPPRAVVLGRFVFAAATANSAAGTIGEVVKYSIPYGGSLGLVVNTTDTRNGDWPEAIGTITYANNATFTVPTDRLVRVEIAASISTADGLTDDTKPIQTEFWPQIDNVNLSLWVVEVSRAWATYYYSNIVTVSAGTHTARLARRTFSPSGRKAQSNYYGPGNHGGIVYRITDAGVA